MVPPEQHISTGASACVVVCYIVCILEVWHKEKENNYEVRIKYGYQVGIKE